ncbi:MAG: LysR family transcriptional regulator [Actinomycetes bacterium]
MPVYEEVVHFGMPIGHTNYVDLRLVGYFLKIYELGSISAAAKDLHVGQPSLSRQLQRFERQLGVSLFDHGLRLTPTAAGVAFVPIARDLLNRASQAEIKVKSLTSSTSLRFTIAGPPTTVADVIAPFIAAAGTAGLLTNIRECLPNAVYKELELGRADIVIGTSPPPARLRFRTVGAAPIWAQVPSNHDLAKNEFVSLAEISSYPIAIVDDNHNVRRIMDDAFAQAGLSSDIAFETQSTHASQALAAAHKAICVSSDDPRYGLIPIPIRKQANSEELAITLFASWDPLHYAADFLEKTAKDLEAFYLLR